MRPVIGFDIGTSAIHLALCDGAGVRRTITEPLPDNLVRAGQILSYDAMGDFIKQLRRQHRLPGGSAALVLPAGLCFCRRLQLPAMTVEQLKVNLPYEFRDYITQDKEKYFYDYALVDLLRDGEGEPRELDLMAAAALKTTIADYRDMFRRAGLRLKQAMPVELAYINLLRAYSAARPGEEAHGHCILDLGHAATRIYMFTGDRFEVLRVIDYGCDALDRALADELHVDVHIAHAYLLANHDDVQQLPCCRRIYSAIAVDLLRAVNFYNFDNPDKDLRHIHCGGGGAHIPALLSALGELLPVPLEDVSELLPSVPLRASDDTLSALAAVGAAMQ